MLDTHSALGAMAAFERDGLRISEAAGFELTQVAGDENDLKVALGKLPGFGVALAQKDRTVFRVAPSQVWVVGKAPEAKNCFVTPLSSGRSRFLVEGATARDVLASCAAVDFSGEAFKPGSVAMTGIHHTPALIHCVSENTLHVYAMRSFALSVFEWLCDAADGMSKL
jgi:heterotetrameric sarcosine oxidase gamma subunit